MSNFDYSQKHLKHISIKRLDNYVHDDEAAVLSEALKENTTITTLSLGSESATTARVCLYEHQNYIGQIIQKITWDVKE